MQPHDQIKLISCNRTRYSISWTLDANALQISSVVHSINVENVFTNFSYIAGRVETALFFELPLNTPKKSLGHTQAQQLFKVFRFNLSVCSKQGSSLPLRTEIRLCGDLQMEGLLSAQEGEVTFSAFVGIVAPVSTLWTEHNSAVTNTLGCEEPFIQHNVLVL